LGEVYNYYHKPEPAVQYVNEALALAVEIGDRAAQAVCLVTRAYAIATAYGHVIEAKPDVEEAVRLAQEIADPHLLAQTLTFAGLNLGWQGEFDRAIACTQEGLELARREHMGFMLGQGLFVAGHAFLAKGEYEEALRRYAELRQYAEAAGDKFWIVRAPNCLGGAHLELYDFAEAIRLNEENDELATRLWSWPEPRGHSLVKLGLAHFYRDDHTRAERAFRRAWELLEKDMWTRWRWHITLLRARGELALAEGRHDEAWDYAVQSLDMASRTDARKHVVRAQWLQGEVLAASGRLEEAARAVEGSVRLAETLQTPRELWMGKAVLGKVLARMGKDKEAEAQFTQAVKVIEAIAEKLKTPRLRHSFLSAEPVLEVYRALGRRPPHVTS
jgi:tetratricopeptide (TPR) repeat protein